MIQFAKCSVFWCGPSTFNDGARGPIASFPALDRMVFQTNFCSNRVLVAVRSQLSRRTDDRHPKVLFGGVETALTGFRVLATLRPPSQCGILTACPKMYVGIRHLTVDTTTPHLPIHDNLSSIPCCRQRWKSGCGGAAMSVRLNRHRSRLGRGSLA